MNTKPKPIHMIEIRGWSYWNIPTKGPIIPRLQEQDINIKAIGFVVHQQDSDDKQ